MFPLIFNMGGIQVTANELAIACKTNGSLIENLWLSVYGLIKLWAMKYCKIGQSNHYDEDDLIQSAYFALLKAVKAYPEDCEFNFTTYLFNSCRNEFYKTMGINRASGQKMVSLNDTINGIEDVMIQDSISDDTAEHEFLEAEHSIYNDSLHEVLDRAMTFVSPKQKEVLESHYYQEKTFNEIAIGFGCSASYIGNLERDALRKLRKGQAYELLKDFDYCSEGLRNTGLTSFKNGFESSVERTVMKKIGIEERYKRYSQADIRSKKQKLLQLIV